MSLDGLHDVPLLPFNVSPVGVDIGNAQIVPPSGNTFYVRGNGTTITELDYDPPGLRGQLSASVAKALTYCVANRGDVIYVLQGHTENLAVAGSWPLVAGVKIIGRGAGPDRPVFTFSAAASTVLVNKANVTIANCRFLAAGPAGTTAITVATAFVVSAAGFTFLRNDVEVGVDADQLCTNCITTTAGAKDMTLASNNFHGGVGSVVTTVLTTTGATDRLKILDNMIQAEVATAATGVLLDLSNAAMIECHILGNHLANNTASAKFVIKPHASSTGFVDGNRYYTGDGATAPAVSAWSTFTTNYKFGQNFCVTAVSVSGLLCPAADA